MGVIPGTTDLVGPVETLDVSGSKRGPLSGVEVFATKIATLRTVESLYHEVAYQVVIPHPSGLIPRVLAYVREHVCPAADPWDHLRLHISVSRFQNLFLE